MFLGEELLDEKIIIILNWFLVRNILFDHLWGHICSINNETFGFCEIWYSFNILLLSSYMKTLKVLYLKVVVWQAGKVTTSPLIPLQHNSNNILTISEPTAWKIESRPWRKTAKCWHNKQKISQPDHSEMHTGHSEVYSSVFSRWRWIHKGQLSEFN